VTSGVELRPLEPGDLEWFARLHNDAFADSPVPVALDASTLAYYLDETDVRPELSRVAYVDGEPAAFCLGAVRDERASIRGEGTGRAYRRRGLGAAVLAATVEALREIGAREIGLEVVGTNAPAVALYERHGFARVRRLLGWTLARPSGRGRRRDADTERAVELLAAWGWRDAPWQLQPETLLHLPAHQADGAVLLGKSRGGRFSLYALAVDPARRREGLGRAALAALPSAAIAVPALVPEEWDDARAFLAGLGAEQDEHWQWEMRLGL
jgi:ribosomal protein S18 acetylase RimI-like enzyme